MTGDQHTSVPMSDGQLQAMREIVEAVARGFTLAYEEALNAEICVFCKRSLACDDFGMSAERDAPGWYEHHITHAPDCPVTRARALPAQDEEQEAGE